MLSQPPQDICDLPSELILEVAKHISFKDHSRWLLANRRYEKCLTRILYLRLLPLKLLPTTDAQNEPIREDTSFTRSAVVRWAVEHGFIRTLEKMDEVESLELSINRMTEKCTASYDPSLELLPLHQASLYGHDHVVEYLLQKGAKVDAIVAGGLLPIHFAKTGEVVQILVAHGSRLDAAGGITPLANSLSHGAKPSAVKTFLQLGADPNHVASTGTTAAEAAVIRNNVDALRILLEAGADVTRPLPDGSFLIFKAIWYITMEYGIAAALKVVRMLLDHDAPPNSGHISTVGPTNRPCFTSNLFLAVMIPYPADLVQLLLERGADQHQSYSRYRALPYTKALTIRGFQNAFSRSLLANMIVGMIWKSDSYHPLEADIIRKLDLLIQYGGDIDSQVKGLTLLQYCLGQHGWKATKALDLIPHLLRHGADASRLDSEGNRPLHTLTMNFFGEVQEHRSFTPSPYNLKYLHLPHLSSLMDLLIDLGADPNVPDARGWTPLIILCCQPHYVLTALHIKVLLGRGVDVNAADERGETALHMTIRNIYFHEPCFRLQVLLNHSGGALDVNVYDKSGCTPLHVLLGEHNFDCRPLHHEDELRQRLTKKRALVILIQAGANVRARVLRSTVSRTLHKWLYDADEVGSMEHIFGLEAADFPASVTETLGDTPLHIACQGRDPAVVDVLIRHGAAADVNSVCRRLRLTPLMMVVGGVAQGSMSRRTMDAMVQLLLAAGADPKLRDARGRTAFDIFLELKITPFPWIWAPCLEGLMPELLGEEQDRLLCLGAKERTIWHDLQGLRIHSRSPLGGMGN